MAATRTITLDGRPLSIEQVRLVACEGAPVTLAPEARARIDAARAAIKSVAALQP